MGLGSSIRPATPEAAGNRPLAGGRAEPRDTWQLPGSRRSPLGAWRHVRFGHAGGFWMNVMGIATRRAPSNSHEPGAVLPAIALREVRKVHGRGDGAVVALDGISTGLSNGSFTAIMGPSGSGKSTFLHVAAGLDRPTSGSVALSDVDLGKLSERRLTILRRKRGGFVVPALN